jgi:uncharacterized membrane protein YvlD (DUF360 family)
MIVFSALALYLTNLWNKGFLVSLTPVDFIKAILAISIVYYLISPIAKLILLPLNIITLGLASFIFTALLLHLINTQFGFITIIPWNFNGFPINYWVNLALSSFSLSCIINILEKFI